MDKSFYLGQTCYHDYIVFFVGKSLSHKGALLLLVITRPMVNQHHKGGLLHPRNYSIMITAIMWGFGPGEAAGPLLHQSSAEIASNKNFDNLGLVWQVAGVTRILQDGQGDISRPRGNLCPTRARPQSRPNPAMARCEVVGSAVCGRNYHSGRAVARVTRGPANSHPISFNLLKFQASSATRAPEGNTWQTAQYQA